MFSDALKTAMTTKENPGDYMKDGVLFCGRCNTPKQALMRLPSLTGTDTPQAFPVMCECQKAAEKAAKEAEATQKFDARMAQLWNGGIHDKSLLRWRFEDDDGGQAQAMNVARKYCAKWGEMFQKNIGILLFGPVGSGKSFISSCIVNELLRQRVPACATGLSRIMNALQSTFDGKQAILDKLSRFHALLLDDVGTQRGTEFAVEQFFSVIDARYNCKRPLIVTTNLTLEELENPENLAYSRIFDRILEMCPVRLCVSGPSRRRGLADERQALARELLL